MSDLKFYSKQDKEELVSMCMARDNKINSLQQKNKQLKEQIEYLRSNEYLNQVKWERNFNEELVKELQQRIDKAIEYIKTHSEMTDLQICGIENVLAFRGSLKELLEILGDKE